MKKRQLLTVGLFILLWKTTAQTAAFESEIRAFERKDSANAPVTGQILLYGSSTIRRWESFETDFAVKDLRVVNRGFGGSQTSEAIQYFERVVVPHRPKYLFFYEGDNDLNAGKSVEDVFSDYKTFIEMVKKQLPTTRLVLFSIKPSPSRIALFDKQKVLNKQLWQLVQQQKGVYFINTFSRMLDANGKPDPRLFKQDMLHMTADGYAIWTKQVQKLLKRLEK